MADPSLVPFNRGNPRRRPWTEPLVLCIRTNNLNYNNNNNDGRKKYVLFFLSGVPLCVLGSAAVAAAAAADVVLVNNIKSMRKWWAACAGVTVGPVQRVRWTGSERARAQNARAAGSVHTRARTSSRRFDSTHPRTHTQARKGSRANAASTDVVVVSTGRRRYGGDGGFRKIIVFGKKKIEIK